MMKHILNSTGHDLKYPDIVRAKNCTLIDSCNNEYLDLESGVWCTPVGHCHPRVTKIISQQSSKIVHSGYCYLNPVIESAAAKIVEITGVESGKCVFLSSGSEAVEYSIKLIQSFSEKPYLLTMKNCYLSAYGVAGERSDHRWIHFDWLKDDNIEKIDFTKIAAFVFEPGSSMGLVQFPPEDLVREIIKRVKQCGGYVVVNEVTTGTGRTGKWFGYNHYDLIPDIVAIGKGLGNGYPVSCVVVAESVVEKVDFAKFHYAQSHQNDPLGAAVAGEVISIIEDENLLLRATDVGERIKNRLNEIRDRYGIIKEVRGRGLMIAIEFEKNEQSSFAEAINEELLKRNIILVKRPGHDVLRLDPALTIENEHVDFFLNSCEEIISEMKNY